MYWSRSHTYTKGIKSNQIKVMMSKKENRLALLGGKKVVDEYLEKSKHIELIFQKYQVQPAQQMMMICVG